MESCKVKVNNYESVTFILLILSVTSTYWEELALSECVKAHQSQVKNIINSVISLISKHTHLCFRNRLKMC